MTDAGQLFTALSDVVGREALTTRLSEEFFFAELGPDAVRSLFTFDDLNDVLTACSPEPPRLRLHRDGSPVPVESYTANGTSSRTARRIVRPEALYRELRAGASLVLDSVDRMHPGVGAAADDLMRLVRERVQANLYLIWGESRGFDTHWDDHDTMIVQLEGTKHWKVHGPGTRAFPMKDDTDHAHTAPVDADGRTHTIWEGVLRPGQIIHVPRGWWHTVTGTGGVSMHLTFGFTRATGIDWANTLVRRLFEEESFRRDLPRFAPADERRKHQHALVARLLELAEAWDMDEVLAERDARFPRRTSFALPWAVQDDPPPPGARVEFVPVLPPPLEHEDGRVAVSVSGKRYRLPAAAAPVLEALAEQRVLTVAGLAERAGTSTEEAARVVVALARHHLVLVR